MVVSAKDVTYVLTGFYHLIFLATKIMMKYKDTLAS